MTMSKNTQDESPIDDDTGTTRGAPLKGDLDVVVEALAVGKTNAEVAALVGTSARTISRRRSDPAVRRAVNARRAELSDHIAGGLADLGADALKVLCDTMSDESSTA